MVPQNLPCAESQVRGSQRIGAQTPPVQASLAAQVPHSRAWPQPSPMVPQNLVAPELHAAGAQLGPPTHT